MRRRGFGLVEVLLAAAILATSFATVFGLIDWTRRTSLTIAARDQARAAAANALTRLAGRSFAELSASFGPTAARRPDPLDDPVVRRSVAFMRPGLAAKSFEGSAQFRQLPDGGGYVQVAVSHPVPSGDRETIVVSRLLPDPALSGLSLDSGPNSLVQRAAKPLIETGGADPRTAQNDRLFFSLLKKLSTSPTARVLDRLMSIDRSDGKYDIDWRRALDLRGPESEMWNSLSKALAEQEVPDGVYDVTVIPVGSRGAPPPGRPGPLTIYRLRDLSGREHFLVRADHIDGLIPPSRMGRAPARDLGTFRVAAVVADGALVEPRDRLEASIVATSSRLFILLDRFAGRGKKIPFLQRMGVFTSTDPLEPMTGSRELTTFLARTSRMMGVELARRKIEPIARANRKDDW